MNQGICAFHISSRCPHDDTNHEQEAEVEKEPMFEKPLTPRDLGRLNHLSFQCSYLCSNTSYMLTKGWSQYVKEKRLDVIDTILFEGHKTDGKKLFIGWRQCSATVNYQTLKF
ncbi:hypothetical protein Patl1_32521 [Pistacia atlantica]|uniref:Uncharacterized protein n=1 Tax=Pistacia atlantica TaxID=434234 RepID=A0ACC1ANW7_9ROSI|nr:hypothetical protein Patl1_32521 [Pistacia atlantica]